MGRWSQYDEDEERLPSGMVRIGYDADDQTYTFRDADGSIWESAPGNRYGSLRKVSGPPQEQRNSYENYNDGADGDDDDLEAPPPYDDPNSNMTKRNQQEDQSRPSWRHEMMPLFNFLLLVGLFLIGVFWYLRIMAQKYEAPKQEEIKCGDDAWEHVISPGSTCWQIATDRDISVEDLLAENPGLDCGHLVPGAKICVPKST